MSRFFPILLLSVSWALPAAAEVQFKAGDFVKQVKHWDSDSNRILAGADEGEAEGCWQVLKVGSADVELKLVSGVFKPWWADEPIAIGNTDTWFDSDGYKEANPKHPPLSQIGATFATVPSCG
ncbi:hypothetical protein [Neorhizobium alkalisoli]|uniref:Uncharacterized protein n=1 Tax=Neorhizobium alkalisoli TaxID=528178 RepID=A0A561R393_9HYPH|nr:hypothetical protein [Neorhizobium alkalisoli]TWF57096.1 hypothetical protein FHW37_102736 [Neorhizobium alkalisoli]